MLWVNESLLSRLGIRICFDVDGFRGADSEGNGTGSDETSIHADGMSGTETGYGKDSNDSFGDNSSDQPAATGAFVGINGMQSTYDAPTQACDVASNQKVCDTLNPYGMLSERAFQVWKIAF